MSDEYINKEEAIQSIIAHDVVGGDARGWAEYLLENTSAVDVAPVRHGRWVESFKVNAPPSLRTRWTCSWCGNVQTYGVTDYCPNCGAIMDGENNEID